MGGSWSSKVFVERIPVDRSIERILRRRVKGTSGCISTRILIEWRRRVRLPSLRLLEPILNKTALLMNVRGRGYGRLLERRILQSRVRNRLLIHRLHIGVYILWFLVGGRRLGLSAAAHRRGYVGWSVVERNGLEPASPLNIVGCVFSALARALGT